MENTVNVNDVSRIAAGTVFKGELTSPGDIRIDGEFEGKIFSKGRVVIGDKARVKGDVICSNVDNFGKHVGNLYVKETLILRSGCSVEGNLNVKRLQVELDAAFNGTCHMIDDQQYAKLWAQLTGQPAGQPSGVKETAK
ncbi:MAG: polymer-forming cytoskeletal protein [Bacteroidales bacterium]|nr:polymer-forming cytoskeletal protein [Bacteroidales bacterium]